MRMAPAATGLPRLGLCIALGAFRANGAETWNAYPYVNRWPTNIEPPN
jgi:hypothetical protein